MVAARTWAVAALVAVLAVLGGAGAQRSASTRSFSASTSEGSVAVGIVNVGNAAAGLSSVSQAVCELLTAMAFEPIDWDLVRAFYETPLTIDTQEMSLRELARGGVGVITGRTVPPEVWRAYQAHFEDEFWLDAHVMYALEGDAENDGARRELAQKTIRDGFSVAMTLSFLREVRHMLSEAHRRGSQRYRVDSVNYDQHAFGLTGFAEAVDTVIKYWDAAWVLFHGYDNGDGDTGRDCAPYGTGEARARDFGLPGDVTYRIEQAFRMGRRYLAQYKYFGDIAFVDEDDMAIMEAHYTSITDALIVTYLRSALQYARNMDRNVPAFPANMRVNQLEGLALFRSVEPLVVNVSDSAAAHIARVLDVSSNMPRADGSIDVSGYESASAAVEAAIDVLLDSMRMDKATQFGSLVV